VSVLAFDLGGTFLRAAVTGGDTLDRFAKHRLTALSGDSGVWNGVTDAIAAYEAAHRSAVAPSAPIVFAFPGPVAANRRILQAPTVVGGVDVPDIAVALEERTGRRVHLLNDLSAAAWYLAEYSDARRFLVVTISSGIGSKLFDRNHPARVLDDPPYAGEIGHFVVDESADAPVCDCGGRGHLGGIASGRGIERAARRQAELDPERFSRSVAAQLARGSALDNEAHIVPAAAAGDEWTWSVIERCTRPLGRAILTTVMAAGLDRVFVVGGFAQAIGAPYQALLTRLILESSGYAVIRDRLASLVTVVEPHEHACLKGCGVYARWRGGRQ
jgi:predicted NBD/HSP70 family sugar kinase